MAQGARPAASRPVSRARVAQQALALCAHADGLAREVQQALEGDDTQVGTLLARREQVVRELAGHVTYLRRTRPAADSAAHVAAEQALDQADALLATVLAAVDSSATVTSHLAARVAARVEALRAELDEMQRSAAAAPRYGSLTLEGSARPRVAEAPVDRPRPLNRQG